MSRPKTCTAKICQSTHSWPTTLPARSVAGLTHSITLFGSSSTSQCVSGSRNTLRFWISAVTTYVGPTHRWAKSGWKLTCVRTLRFGSARAFASANFWKCARFASADFWKCARICVRRFLKVRAHIAFANSKKCARTWFALDFVLLFSISNIK